MSARIILTLMLGMLVFPAFAQDEPPQATEELLREAAEQGDALAQAALGIMYYYGLEVPQDYAEAARWYRMAADQGDADAQLLLGIMYSEGTSRP